jgi:heterodisulfide reductase subunit D
MPDRPFEQALDRRVAEVLERHTACGACLEVCPMPGPAGIDASEPGAIAAGVLHILRGATEPAASARWAAVCSGSGHCIQACQHGVNPGFMLTMAQLAMQHRMDGADRRRDAFARFTGMTIGVRVLSRLQLPPELLTRFRDDGELEERADLVFYTGRNLLKTPHIALLCFDIMESLSDRYRMMGGPSHCCGILQFPAGDLATSGQVASRTVERLGGGAGGRMLSWCSTCQVQLGEVAAPGKTDTRLDVQPFLIFLAERLDELRSLLKHPVRKRVGLHEQPGVTGVAQAASAILQAVPGLDFVDLRQPPVGYMCNKLNAVPEFKRELHRGQLQAAADAGVTTLAAIYCHRELCSHERDWPFEVVNFLEVLGESMGLIRPDLFRRLELTQAVDAIPADRAALLESDHVGLDEARDVILADMRGEQPLHRPQLSAEAVR